MDARSVTDDLELSLQTATVINGDRIALSIDEAKILLEAARRGDDGYHTMDELYEYRMLYNALAFNSWASHNTVPVVKSKRHSDGELCFGGGWFIVVAELPTGQISNHYRLQYWDLFDLPEAELAPEYDGHTPQVAAKRMLEMLTKGFK